MNKIGHFIKKHSILIGGIILFILLRLPSLFEPHWYGDEGIYGSVGYAIEHGKKLYVNIFDNRLPAIYYLYGLGTSESRLLFIRTLNMIAGIISVSGIYWIGKKMNLKQLALIPFFIGIILLGSSRIEGNIANTENFFLPLTIWGTALILKPTKSHLFWSGFLFGCAFLFKFSPFFTCVAVGLYLFLSTENWLKKGFERIFLYGLGFLTPIVTTFILLFLNGDLIQALQYGLLNNFRYVNSFDNYNIPSQVKTTALLILVALMIFLYWKKIISQSVFLISLILTFDFYSAIFAGRAYEHYLQQVVPGLSLLPILTYNALKKYSKLGMALIVTACFVILINAGLTIFYKGMGNSIGMKQLSYYDEFISSALHQKPKTHDIPFYYGTEDAQLVTAKEAVNRFHTQSIYYYTGQPWIYDYAHVTPPTFFVAVYHTTLIANGKDRLIEDLRQSRPRLIVVEKKAPMFDNFQHLLTTDYQENSQDAYFAYYLHKN